MTLQPISVNLYQTLLPARRLSNSKGLKKKRFLLNGFPESEKDRYFIAFKGKLMTEKPKLPCIQGRFVLLQVQEGEKIYYLWANRNSLVKRLGIDKKSLPKTHDYTSFIQHRIPKKQVAVDPQPEIEIQQEEREALAKKERALAHTAWLRGGDLTEESKKRMHIAYEIGIYIFSLLKKEETPPYAIEAFRLGCNIYFPKFWDPVKDKDSNNPEYINARHLVRGLALGGGDFEHFCLHTPFGQWNLFKLKDYPGVWEKVQKELGLELDKNPEHARVSSPIYRITKWKGETLDELEYTQVDPALIEKMGERKLAEIEHEAGHFLGIICDDFCPNINEVDRKQEKAKNIQILLDLIDQQRVSENPPLPQNEATTVDILSIEDPKKERALAHTAWIQGGKLTEESKKRMQIAFEIGIYIFSLNKRRDPPQSIFQHFIDGLNFVFPKFWDPNIDRDAKYINPEMHNPRHLVRGLALAGKEYDILELHTPFGRWTLTRLDENADLFEKIKDKLGLELDENPEHARLKTPIYRITKWKGQNLDNLEYTLVSNDLWDAYQKVKKEILPFPGIAGADEDNEKNDQILLNLIEEQRRKNEAEAPPPPPKDALTLTREERARVHTAWFHGAPITEESKKRMQIAYEIGIYFLSLTKDPRIDLFQWGVRPEFPKTWEKPNPYFPHHLVKGLAIACEQNGGGSPYFRLHTPLGEWTLGSLRHDLFEKLRVELGLEVVETPKFSNTIYAIRKWKGEELEEPEYTCFDLNEINALKLITTIKQQIVFPGIGPDQDKKILVDLIEEQRKKNQNLNN